jgi:hypothetical protein
MTDDFAAFLLTRVTRIARRYRGTPLGMDEAVGVGLLAAVEAERANWGDDPAGMSLQRAAWRMKDAYRSHCGIRRPSGLDVPMDEMPGATVVDQYFPLRFLWTLRPEVARIVVYLGAGYTRHEIAAAWGVHPSRISYLLREAKSSSRAAVSTCEV